MESSEIASQIFDLARQAADQCQFEFVHAEVVGRKGSKTIRVYIDKPDGINHDDCVEMSRLLDSLLEESDPISSAFVLEVSSPGIERGLYKFGDYERFSGESAKLKTHRPIGGQRNFSGKIISAENQKVIFDDRASGRIEIEYGEIKKGNLEFDMERELKRGRS